MSLYLSRISDNKHHVCDVVAEALVGAAGTLFLWYESL